MPENPEEPKTEGAVGESKKARSPYAQLPFDLKTEELTQTGTQKMLLGEVERLNTEVGSLKDFATKFHDTDKRLAVLRSKFRQYTALEILYTMGVASGFAVFGWLLPLSTWSARHWVALAFALLFVSIAVWGKWVGVHHED